MRLRKRGFYHYDSWQLATYLALRYRRRLQRRTFVWRRPPRRRTKTVSASALTPRQVESRRPAVGSGVKTRARTNEIQPRHEFLDPAPTPRKKQNKKQKEKLLALWLCTVTSCGDSLMSIKVPQTCRTGCWRAGAGVKRQGQVFELGGGGANRVSLSVRVFVCVVIFQSGLFL